MPLISEGHLRLNKLCLNNLRLNNNSTTNAIRFNYVVWGAAKLARAARISIRATDLGTSEVYSGAGSASGVLQAISSRSL